MMANDVECADKARQQGNDFYKAGKIKQGERLESQSTQMTADWFA